MYEKRTVVKVEDWGDKWQVVYAVEYIPENPDEVGYVEQSGHCFPKDVFEWRAAEYGIDPADMDTLVDVVLAEPFLSQRDYAPGESLHDALSIARAREYHLARCSLGKLRARVATRGAVAKPGGLLHRIRTESPMDDSSIASKKDHVREQRRLLAQQNGDRKRTDRG